ncbi:hypothetical protein CRG98_026747 [Punica granatum]|uniref:Uncharacterized protein n=1 Tax=Punica granatum TaxID=22663 RepID=A0A2I0JB97_PUNGR|nr:hypothetical protein CRG98_026747 [Punica granatum]
MWTWHVDEIIRKKWGVKISGHALPAPRSRLPFCLCFQIGGAEIDSEGFAHRSPPFGQDHRTPVEPPATLPKVGRPAGGALSPDLDFLSV